MFVKIHDLYTCSVVSLPSIVLGYRCIKYDNSCSATTHMENTGVVVAELPQTPEDDLRSSGAVLCM